MPAARAASKPPVAKVAEAEITVEAPKDGLPEFKNIREKILYVQKNIEVEKLGEHPQRKGKHLRFEDVLAEVVDEYLNKLDLITTIRNLRGTHSPAFDQGGRYKPSAFIQGTFVFIDVATGEEWPIEVSGEGSSVGGSDSTRIAHTTFAKIAYLETFKIREENASRFDSDDAATLIPDAVLPPAEKSEAEQKSALTLKELTDKVTNHVKNNDVPGKAVNKEGTKIAGEGVEPKDWKQDARVMEALVKVLDEQVEQVKATGEVPDSWTEA